MFGNTSRRDFLKASALVSAGTLLAACGPAKTTEGAPADKPATTAKTKLVFNSYTWSGYEAATRQVIADWAATRTDVEVEGQFVPQDNYWDKIQTMVASGSPPDVGIADYGRVVSYAKNGTLLPISPYVESSKFPVDKMIPAATSQYRWMDGDFDSGNASGTYYGLPSDAQSQIMVYNKKMFDEAGVGYPTDDWTWDDVVEAAKKLTKADENKWGILAIPTYILFKGNFVWSAGGALHNPEFTKSMLNDPGTLEAYKWNWDLIYTHKVAPPVNAMGSTNAFMTGNVAMYIEGDWWISDFAAGIKDFEWDVCLFPKHPKTGKRTTTVEADGWWIYKGGKQPDMAWEMISYLASEKGQATFGKLNYIIPSNFEEVGKEWYSRTPPANRMKAWDNIVMDSKKVDFTYFEFGTIINAVAPAIDIAFTDGNDITKALEEANTIMDEELTKAWVLYKG
jgi:multiple sugar transport system substrate-binding protein